MSTIKFDTKLNTDKLKKRIDEFKNNVVLKVGFIDPAMAKIAVIQEYGAHIPVTKKMRGFFASRGIYLSKNKTEIVIPPRPFMRATIDKNKNKWKQSIISLLSSEDPQKAIGMLGEIIKADIQYTISNNDFEKNADLTVLWKGRNQPLIDKGKMRNAVAYEVTS